MTDTTADQPIEGRRRADFPEGRTVAAMRPRDPWDAAVPTDGPTAPPRPMLEDAFTFATDRLDRLEHLLGSLNATVMRAGTVLEPLLTDGSYGEPEADPQLDTTEATPEDRRSTIAKRVARLGTRADNLADATSYVERRLEAILDALEV